MENEKKKERTRKKKGRAAFKIYPQLFRKMWRKRREKKKEEMMGKDEKVLLK